MASRPYFFVTCGDEPAELGLEENLRVESDLGRVPTEFPRGLDGDEMDAREPGALDFRRQVSQVLGGLGQVRRPVDEEQRLTFDRDRPPVARARAAASGCERGRLRCCSSGRCSRSSSLPSQRRDHGSLAQQRQNGKSGSPDASTSSNGPLEEALAVEPVVVVAEAVDAVRSGEVACLLPRYLGQPQVVEAEVGGHVRLIVAREQRLAPARRCATR